MLFLHSFIIDDLLKFKLYIIYLYFRTTTLQYNTEIENCEKCAETFQRKKKESFSMHKKTVKTSFCFQLNSSFF